MGESMKRITVLSVVASCVLALSVNVRAELVPGALVDAFDVSAVYSGPVDPPAGIAYIPPYPYFPPVVTSSAVLASGQMYAIMASGTYMTTPALSADAKYTTQDDWATYSDYLLGYENKGTGLCELYVDGYPADWGSYNMDHEYTVAYLGAGSSVDFQIDDYYATNNTGALTVTIYELLFRVDIDIKPGSCDNPINPGSKGVVPVAIFSSEDFDATTVDPMSILIAGRGVAVQGRSEKPMAHIEDVDGDGLADLLIQVETQGDGDAWESGMVELTGMTYDGQKIVGYDVILVVPVKK